MIADVGALAVPVSLRGRTAPSRVLFGPHPTNLGRRREISDRHVAYYARRAHGGCGVIVTETASVHPSDWPYERAPLAVDAVPGWAEVRRACRPALVLAGLGHAGAQGSSAYSQAALWGPSRVADAGTREMPMELEQPEIDALVEGFASAAGLAVSADLDGVEIDAGQHAILRQFLSGLTNQRSDAYGRDRTLLLRQVLGAVRAALGDDRVLGLRLCCDELAPWAGITPELLPAVPDVDLLVVVRGSGMTTHATRPDLHTTPGFNRDLCADVRAALITGRRRGAPAPLITGGGRRVGLREPPGARDRGGGAGAGPVISGRAAVVLQGSVVDVAFAEAALREGVADLVEMTRAQITDPDLVAHVRAGTPERIRPATLSNQRTHVRDPRNPIVSDDAEPGAGHETESLALPRDAAARPSPAAGRPRRDGRSGSEWSAVRGGDAAAAGAGASDGRAVAREVLVVGGGPAGLEAARELALAGNRVRLVERLPALGGALRLAARVAGRARMGVLIPWWERELERLGVTVETGVRIGPAELDAAENAGVAVLLATGSRSGPRAYPSDVPVLTAAEYEAGAALTGGPAVVHDPVGDWTGVGVAEQLAADGRAVSLVTPDPVAGTQLSITGDLVPATTRLDRAGVVRELRSELVEVVGGAAVLRHVWTGDEREIPCAFVIDCGHRLPEDALWRARPRLHRAGDCVAPRTVHEAILEGRRAAAEVVRGRRRSGDVLRARAAEPLC